jgi:hypothetical protein
MRFFAVNGRVYGETLSSSEGYGSYNEGSDDYQPNTFSLGTVNNTLVVGAK